MPRKLRYNYDVQGVSEIRDTTSGGVFCTHELRHSLHLRGSLVLSCPNCGPFYFTRIGTESVKGRQPSLVCKSLCRGLPIAVLATKNRNKYTNCFSRSFNIAQCSTGSISLTDCRTWSIYRRYRLLHIPLLPSVVVP